MPADYLGLGYDQVAVFRPRTSEWFVRQEDGSIRRIQWRLGYTDSERPMPADYLGQGNAQPATFGGSTWYILKEDGSELLVSGSSMGQPVPGDYLGLGRDQFAQFDPSSGQWTFRTDQQYYGQIQWGQQGDLPVPGNYSSR